MQLNFKKTPTQLFSFEFFKIFKNTVLTEYLQATASEVLVEILQHNNHTNNFVKKTYFWNRLRNLNNFPRNFFLATFAVFYIFLAFPGNFCCLVKQLFRNLLWREALGGFQSSNLENRKPLKVDADVLRCSIKGLFWKDSPKKTCYKVLIFS